LGFRHNEAFKGLAKEQMKRNEQDVIIVTQDYL
jgi:hypothetical protein